MPPLLVLGLFGFLGKAVKGIGKVVGGAVKIGLGAAKLAGGLGLIPGGSLIGRVAGTLLAAKSPMSNPKVLSQTFNLPTALRGKSPLLKLAGTILTRTAQTGRTQLSTPRLQQMSPVLPGGAIATRGGPVASSGGAPPMSYSAGASPSRKRKRRSTSRKRSTKKRSGRGRRLKFGSPAWRKKYLGHGRKKRRKRAA